MYIINILFKHSINIVLAHSCDYIYIYVIMNMMLYKIDALHSVTQHQEALHDYRVQDCIV